MLKIILSGANGKMGNAVASVINPNTEQICGGVDLTPSPNVFPVFKSFDECFVSADIVIDFSHPTLLPPLLKYCTSKSIPLVTGTTGLSAADEKRLKDAAKKIPVFYAANMSFGVFVFNKLVKEAAKALSATFDIEITEAHHKHKADAPSGTAITLLKNIQSVVPNLKPVFGRSPDSLKRSKSEIGLNAIRGGSIAGRHSVLFAGEGETIELIHNAESKEIFARGALLCAHFLCNKSAGLYGMNDLLLKTKSRHW